jgi:hypothetical protein
MNGNRTKLVNLVQYYMRYNMDGDGIDQEMSGESGGDGYRRMSMTFSEDKGKDE